MAKDVDMSGLQPEFIVPLDGGRTLDDAFKGLTNFYSLTETAKEFGRKKNLSTDDLSQFAYSVGGLTTGNQEEYLNATPQAINHELGSVIENRKGGVFKAIEKHKSDIFSRFTSSLDDLIEANKKAYEDNRKFQDIEDRKRKDYIFELQVYAKIASLFKGFRIAPKYTESYINNEKNSQYDEDYDKFNEYIEKFTGMLDAHGDKEAMREWYAEGAKEMFGVSNNFINISNVDDNKFNHALQIYARIIGKQFVKKNGNSFTIDQEKIRKLFGDYMGNYIPAVGAIAKMQKELEKIKVETKAHKIVPR